ncbi:MAG: 50S ribosomal protein L11 methyltransferase [Thermoanaerobaculia bacterium]
MADYLRLRFTLTSASEDRLVAELWALCTQGIESPAPTDDACQQMLAYFGEPLSPELSRRLESSAKWPGSRLEGVESVPAVDWLSEYRRQLRPIELGSGFLVDSREPADSSDLPSSERVLLRIPARSAFGTGSHESTQLALELMEGLTMAGLRVLDVGTGTGILAFAALVLGAGEVVGLDIETASVLLALENCRLNRLSPRLVAGTLDCLRATQRFDLALVNVLPGRIRAYLGSIVELLPQGGKMVVSGVLAEQHESYIRELECFGLREERSSRSGDWMGSLMEKAQ